MGMGSSTGPGTCTMGCLRGLSMVQPAKPKLGLPYISGSEGGFQGGGEIPGEIRLSHAHRPLHIIGEATQQLIHDHPLHHLGRWLGLRQEPPFTNRRSCSIVASSGVELSSYPGWETAAVEDLLFEHHKVWGLCLWASHRDQGHIVINIVINARDLTLAEGTDSYDYSVTTLQPESQPALHSSWTIYVRWILLIGFIAPFNQKTIYASFIQQQSVWFHTIYWKQSWKDCAAIKCCEMHLPYPLALSYNCIFLCLPEIALQLKMLTLEKGESHSQMPVLSIYWKWQLAGQLLF